MPLLLLEVVVASGKGVSARAGRSSAAVICGREEILGVVAVGWGQRGRMGRKAGDGAGMVAWVRCSGGRKMELFGFSVSVK